MKTPRTVIAGLSYSFKPTWVRMELNGGGPGSALTSNGNWLATQLVLDMAIDSGDWLFSFFFSRLSSAWE